MPYAYNEEIINYNIEKKTESSPDSMRYAHYHNHYEIYYLVKGKASYFIDNTTFDLSAGDMVLIPPYIIHRTAYVKDGHLERLLIHFKRDFIEKNENDPSLKCFSCHYIKNADLYKSIIKSIESESHNKDEFTDEIIKNNLNTLLIKLSRDVKGNALEINAPSFIQKIADYITQNYEKEISLDTLSRQFSVSKSHLSRQFKATTGFGLNEYITMVRIRNAERLILTTSLSMTHIATKCGFNDSNYFSSVFKKIKGVPPLKFKNNII